MEKRLKKLKIYNSVVGSVLLVQGVVMWLVSKKSTLPVTINNLEWDEVLRRPVSTPEVLIDVNLGPLVASFLILSGLFLLGSAYLWRKQYESQIQKGINLFRWLEYSITSSLMVVVIAMLCGVYDFSSLLMIFSLNACMIFFGWVMEIHNQTTKKTDWTSYIFGCFAGLIPWVVMGIYFFNAVSSNADAVPTFVYYIFGSLFISFNIFAINMILQYKKVGKWKDYLYGEYSYITLSLVAKALLAWQVWGGTLR